MSFIVRSAAIHLNPTGKKRCIMLHGYGDCAATMSDLAHQKAANGAEVIVFDLPWHGESTWAAPIFTANDLFVVLSSYLQGCEKPYELLGFSLGGRLALVVLPYLAQANQAPEAVYLLAPAGAPQNFVHNYLEMPLFLKRMMQFLMQKPNFTLIIAEKLYQWKVLSKFEYAFAQKYLGSQKYSNMMFAWWQSLSYLTLDFNALNNCITHKNIKVHLYFGTKDTVLPPKSAFFYKKKLLHDSCTYLPVTHRGMTAIVLEQF